MWFYNLAMAAHPNARETDPAKCPISADDEQAGEKTFLDRTMARWQPRSERTLTREDARQIVENATGFVQVLLEWEAAERSAPDPSPADVTKAGSPGTVQSIE